jgi:hypothetical protein
VAADTAVVGRPSGRDPVLRHQRICALSAVRADGGSAGTLEYRFQITRWISTRRPSLLAALSGLAVLVFMYSFGYDWVE